MITKKCIYCLNAINRTKVELKLGIGTTNPTSKLPINRTKVELKHKVMFAVVATSTAINRTKVELKLF